MQWSSLLLSFASAIGRMFVPPLVVGVVFLVLLELVISGFEVSGLVVPRPSDVLDLLATPEFLKLVGDSAIITWKATLIGFGIGAGIGVLTGVVMSESRTMKVILYPYVVVFQSLPKIAMAPVYVLWLGFGLFMKASFAAMLAFFPAAVATLAALLTVSPARLEMANAFCAGRVQRFWRISLPSAVPGILSGLEIAMSFALIGAIVGEFVAPSGGLGQLLLYYTSIINVPAEFATLFCLMLLGVLQNRILFSILQRLCRRFSKT